MALFFTEKSTNVRIMSSGDGFLDHLFRPWSQAAHQVEEGVRLYLHPERAVSPPALPEPAGAVVLAVPGFTPHLAARLWGADRGGAAPLVLLAHDWEGQVHDLMPFVQPLLDAGARVVAFDAPAHGRSSGDQAHVLDFARAIPAVAAAAGGVPAAVIAHGIGAAALTLAIQDGFRPGRAVLLAPLADLSLPVRQIAHVLRLDLDGAHALAQRIDRRLGRPLSALSLQGDASVPALLIHAVDDRIMPVADALHLASLWPGLETRLVNGLGHRRLLADVGVIDQSVGFALQA